MAEASPTRREKVPTVPAAAQSQRSMDFVGDALADGRRFRVLTVINDRLVV